MFINSTLITPMYIGSLVIRKIPRMINKKEYDGKVERRSGVGSRETDVWAENRGSMMR